MATEKKAEVDKKEEVKNTTESAPAKKPAEEKKTGSKEQSSRKDGPRGRRPDNRRQRRPYRGYYRRRQKQIVPAYVDWKDVDYLQRFVPERGKILPRRISGVSAKDQRRIAKAIKRARVMALLPYVGD